MLSAAVVVAASIPARKAALVEGDIKGERPNGEQRSARLSVKRVAEK